MSNEAEWIEINRIIRCDFCGGEAPSPAFCELCQVKTKYCPHCGKEMKNGEEYNE